MAASIAHSKTISQTARTPKLVFIMSNFTYGGAEKQWLEYLSAIPDDMDFDTEIITFLPNPPESIASQFADLGVKVTLVDRSSMSFPRFFLTLAHTLRQMRPQVVHTVLTGSVDTWGRLAAWLIGVPVIIHSELQIDSEVTRSQRLLRPFLDRLTDKFLPNAHATADWLAAKGIPRRNITFIPNATDVERFKPGKGRSMRADWGIPEDALVAGFIAKFRAEKRIDVLLDAVLSLPEAERPDYLVMGGNGELMPTIKAKVEADPWLNERALILGMVSDTPSFFESIDYLILTSDKEGVPNVVLEALATEKPVVSTDVTDLPILLKDAGFVGKMGDPKSVAAAIRQMNHLSTAERAELGKRGREMVVSKFEQSYAAKLFWEAHEEYLK